MPSSKRPTNLSETESSRRPLLRGVQTDDLSHHALPVDDISVDEQAAVLQAMSLESPPGLVQSPSSYSTEFGQPSPAIASAPITPLTPTTPTSATSSKFKAALEDVRHFAGGLIAHPYESTKHYSILRHSHGLVYYSGSSTNLAITIFSDRELPADRTLWLQRKGFSGKTGLKIGGLLGARSTWIEVTPTVRATAEQLNPTDERAWQRDIKKFLKKAPKEIRSHRVRETDVLRIPCDADDGYLRVVLCTAEGKKVLCGSPVFRLASSTTEFSTIRGASLKTMPLEAGIKIGQIIGNNIVSATLTPLADQARSTVTGQISQIYQPSFGVQEAATYAYDQSGVPDKIDDINQQYDGARQASYSPVQQAAYDALQRPDIVGPTSGPVSPFPVRIHGKVVPGTGRSKAMLNVPTANLTGVPEDTLMRYKGVFFGWAAVTLPKKLAVETKISDDWLKAVIFISPDPLGRRTVLHKNSARVYLLHGFQGVQFFDAKLSVLLMGYLRGLHDQGPDEEPDVESMQFDIYKDIAVTTASLNRPAWTAEATLDRVKSAASSRSMSERYVDFRQNTQRQMDRVPVNRLGIRTEGAVLKDRLIGVGGVWVPRQPLAYAHTA
ncbi:hypothetical protein H2202_003336 [Exophiala xenobiotica]|nr:hypothetical protein H2202_003336 [Exophiala xenobiotica]KAK5210784.1 hypothetical protein LTR41_003396 [Exophiala xenobiotica]KAK5249185.1 hypothetical protein LTS06_005839 [Exophiala xenobiotica]KAK5354883.1 hypothetical protein LTR61_002183 [Exophiala xenobiotica]KAK5381533.1 hypothetical protein LTR11_003018 [Exophiala xenobiotica]